MITFRKEHTPLATKGFVRTGSSVLKIGKSTLEIYQLQLNERLYRYDVHVTRDGSYQTYYPKSYFGLEEILEIVSQFEHEKEESEIG